MGDSSPWVLPHDGVSFASPNLIYAAGERAGRTCSVGHRIDAEVVAEDLELLTGGQIGQWRQIAELVHARNPAR